MFALLMLLATADIGESRRASTQPDALDAFTQRLEAYLQVRAEAARTLAPLSPTANAVELAARQEALAAAVRRARARARRGDVIPGPLAERMTDMVREEARRRGALVAPAHDDEAAPAGLPVINRAYHEQDGLVPVPPLLLGKLPRLPESLQYRFFGRHLVILDGDLQLVVDYVANALPPR